MHSVPVRWPGEGEEELSPPGYGALRVGHDRPSEWEPADAVRHSALVERGDFVEAPRLPAGPAEQEVQPPPAPSICLTELNTASPRTYRLRKAL